MKPRYFFIALLLLSIGVGSLYFVDFIRDHPNLDIEYNQRFWRLASLAVALQLSGHWLRSYKSRFLLNHVRPARTSTLFKGLSVGYLFNALLPLRAGELVRAYFVGDALSISKTTVFMSIIIERVVDGLTLGISLVSASLLIGNTHPMAAELIMTFGTTILLVAVLLCAGLYLVRAEHPRLLRLVHSVSSIFNDQLSARLRFMGWSGIYGTKLMTKDAASLRRYVVASLVMWEFYFLSTACVVAIFFANISANDIWAVVQGSYAGVSAPAGPGYVGSFHATVSDLLNKLSLVNSGGFTLTNWLIIISPVSLVGLFVIIRQRLGERTEAAPESALINKLHRDRDITPEMSHFLDAYFTGDRINQILTQAELNDDFKLMKAFKGGSNASTMLVWQSGELRVKKITLPQYADKLREQAKWLTERAALPHLPRVVDEESADHYYSFDLQYEEAYAPFFDYIHSHTSSNNADVLASVIEFCDEAIYKPVKPHNPRDNLVSYIGGKVLGKVNDTATMSSDVSRLLAYDKLVINGQTYTNLPKIVDQLRTNKQAMSELADYRETPIHGDLTIDNLIVSAKGEYILVDPNNENQVSAAVVDYGKLYQSLHSGYEFLIQLKNCSVQDNSVAFEDAKSQKYSDLFGELDSQLRGKLSDAEYRTILFHEAVHYCRMLTYRANINPQTVAVFYATAVKLFNDFLAQYQRPTTPKKVH